MIFAVECLVIEMMSMFRCCICNKIILLQLGHLLKTVVNSCDDFSPQSSLFIGNKWENVPEKDKEDVKKDIFDKLGKVYPGISQNQIHFMSISKVSYPL